MRNNTRTTFLLAPPPFFVVQLKSLYWIDSSCCCHLLWHNMERVPDSGSSAWEVDFIGSELIETAVIRCGLRLYCVAMRKRKKERFHGKDSRLDSQWLLKSLFNVPGIRVESRSFKYWLRWSRGSVLRAPQQILHSFVCKWLVTVNLTPTSSPFIHWNLLKCLHLGGLFTFDN